jgi:DNA-binding beta-propeller fold protein YncE
VTTDQSGNLYIANSGMRTIYRLDVQKDTLDKFINLRNYPQLTGLTISPDDKYLFVAYANGLLCIELATQKITPLKHPENILLSSCDGLYFYNNSLITIQNFLNRVVRLELSPDFTGVTGYKIIESNNPDFGVPSSGVIDGKYFYYIANSQINNLDRTGKVQNADQLKDILILKAKL